LISRPRAPALNRWSAVDWESFNDHGFPPNVGLALLPQRRTGATLFSKRDGSKYYGKLGDPSTVLTGICYLPYAQLTEAAAHGIY
jgi:hypothetical protein